MTTPPVHIVADYELSFDEFAHGYREQQRRRRFLSGPPARSHWIGCGVIASIFVLLLIATAVVMVLTGHEVADATGRNHRQSDAPIFSFLVGLLPWTAAAGLIWFALARSLVQRRLLWRVMVVILLVGASSSLVGVIDQRY